MTLSNLQERLHAHLLDVRRLERYVHTDSFILYYTKATVKERENLIRLISQHAVDELVQIVEKENLTYRELRERALALHIPRYSLLTKEQLLAAIRSKTDESQFDRTKEIIERMSSDEG